MKILLYIFSGTGNTLKIAQAYRANFLPHETTIYEISSNLSNCPNPNDFDLVGFGYPIHGFNTPYIFDKFVRKLPKTNKKKCFIFKTSGEPLAANNSSSQRIIRKLEKKNYEIMSERHFVMPYNIIIKHSKTMAKAMWIYAQKLVQIHASEVLEGKKERVRKIFFKRIHTFVFRIEWGYAKIQGPTFRVNKKKCIKCDLCMNTCPTKNISFKKGKYKFKNNCTLCMRCSFNCPKSAISIGLLNLWKVNGDYRLRQLENDDTVPFPNLENEKWYARLIYRKYYKKADELIKANTIMASLDELAPEKNAD